MKNRRDHTAEFKTQVVLEMLSGEKSVAQISRDYQIKDSLLYRWKAEFLERAPQVFAPAVAKAEREQAARVAELERLVGRLTLELEVAKKASTLLRERRRSDGRSPGNLDTPIRCKSCVECWALPAVATTTNRGQGVRQRSSRR